MIGLFAHGAIAHSGIVRAARGGGKACLLAATFRALRRFAGSRAHANKGELSPKLSGILVGSPIPTNRSEQMEIKKVVALHRGAVSHGDRCASPGIGGGFTGGDR
ncbi:MAG TPA: hypothetical protein VIL42_10530 [Sphingomicrobium sp.]|jgi:hypothetical protein